MADITELSAKLQEKLANKIEKLSSALGEITVVIARENLVSVAKILRDDADFAFNQLMDVCGIDYLHYVCIIPRMIILRMKIFLYKATPMKHSVLRLC
jgi:NADH:ubiquinone oxidoreductase subunit C